MVVYILAGYILAVLIKMFGGMKDIPWSWYILGPLWAALYWGIVLFLRFIVMPIVVLFAFYYIGAIFYWGFSGDGSYLYLW